MHFEPSTTSRTTAFFRGHDCFGKSATAKRGRVRGAHRQERERRPPKHSQKIDITRTRWQREAWVRALLLAKCLFVRVPRERIDHRSAGMNLKQRQIQAFVPHQPSNIGFEDASMSTSGGFINVRLGWMAAR